MEQTENEQLLRFLRHGISSFLAGIFLIITVLQLPTIPTSGIDVKFAQYMSWIIGGVFIIVAFSIILTVFPICKVYRGWAEKLETRLLPVVYIISIAQLSINVALFYVKNLILLFTITGVFLLVVLVAMIYMIRKRNILNYIPTLMAATLTFNALSITLLFMKVSNWQIIPYSVIGIVLLIRTMLRYEKVHMQKVNNNNE